MPAAAAASTTPPFATAATTMLAISLGMLTFLLQRALGRKAGTVGLHDQWFHWLGATAAGLYTAVLAGISWHAWAVAEGSPRFSLLFVHGHLKQWLAVAFVPPLVFGVAVAVFAAVEFVNRGIPNKYKPGFIRRQENVAEAAAPAAAAVVQQAQS